MRNRQEWFNEKMAADIIARLDAILKQKNMTQKDLARKMGAVGSGHIAVDFGLSHSHAKIHCRDFHRPW